MTKPADSLDPTLKLLLGLWLASICLETGAQLAIKHAADIDAMHASQFAWFLALVTEPWFSIAVLFYLFGFFVWMAILRYHKLSVAVPVSSVSDVTVVVVGTIVFSEPVSGSLICGILVIATGIWLLTLDESKSDSGPLNVPKNP